MINSISIQNPAFLIRKSNCQLLNFQDGLVELFSVLHYNGFTENKRRDSYEYWN